MTDLVLTDLPVYNAVLAEIRITSAFDDLSVWKFQTVYGLCVVGFQFLGHISKFLVFFRRFGTVWRHNFFYCAHQLACEIRCPSHKRAQSQFRHNVLSQIIFSGLQQFDGLFDRSIFVRIFFHSRHVHGHQCFEMHNDVPFWKTDGQPCVITSCPSFCYILMCLYPNMTLDHTGQLRGQLI